MKTRIFLLFTFFLSMSEFAQNNSNNIWYFGNFLGLDFNTTSPAILTNSAMSATDMSATISDSSGALLFYTNGINVYNKNHVVMANGFGLLGGTTGGQAASICKLPNSATKYYIFTNDQFGGLNGFRYSVVDMNANAGAGLVTIKNQPIFSNSTEKCIIVPHQNNLNFWIITHELNNNTFRAYLFDSTGISIAPVLSNVGTSHVDNGYPFGYGAAGQLNASPNGQKIASALYAQGVIDILDFNRTTGILSFNNTINYYRAWGCEFSPNNQFLYYSNWQGNGNIMQYDIANNTSVNIGSLNSPGYFQLAPDNKIYIAKYLANSIASINQPNTLGLPSQLVDASITFANISNAGLPNTIKYISNELYTDSLTLTADYDAAIGFHDGNPINTANLNFGGAIQNAAYAVPSAFGQGLNGNRALIHFDLSSIPVNATITSAKLDLYSISQIGSFPAHFGTNNNALIERVLSPWTEYGVTWTNQPLTTSLNAQTLIGTNNPNQDYLDIDVTAMINDMRTLNANYGLKLRLTSQLATNLLSFCSMNFPDSTKHPKLRVSYTLSNSLSSPSIVQKIEQVFKISPNPTNSILNLNYNLNQYKNANFQLFDIQGKLVYQTALNTSDDKAILDLDRLDNGLYFAKLFADGILVKTEKIVKRDE